MRSESLLSTGDRKSLEVAGLKLVQSALGTEPVLPNGPRAVSKPLSNCIVEESYGCSRPLFSRAR